MKTVNMMGFTKVTDGYRFGNWFLVKSYGFGSSYSWVVTKDFEGMPKMDCEFWKWFDENESKGTRFVGSCKEGKEIIKANAYKDLAYRI